MLKLVWLLINLRNFFTGFDITRCKEGNFGKSQILMFEINTNWDDVGRAWMIEEATHVSIEIGIDAVMQRINFKIIKLKVNSNAYIWCSQVKEVAIVCPSISFLVSQNFTDVLSYKWSFANLHQALNAIAFNLVIAFEDNERKLHSILNHSILAQKSIALTHIIAFKEHWRIGVVEVGD